MPGNVQNIHIKPQYEEDKDTSGEKLLFFRYKAASIEQEEKQQGDRSAVDQRKPVGNIAVKGSGIKTREYLGYIEVTLKGQRYVFTAALTP